MCIIIFSLLFNAVLFSLPKHYLDLYITATALCTVSLLLYLMVLKTISPGCGVRASLMLILNILKSSNNTTIVATEDCCCLGDAEQIACIDTICSL